MTNRIGLTLLPTTPDIDAALDLGADVYLLLHHPETPAVVDHILERRPDARILIRRYGGVDDARSVADQIAAWYPLYAVRGVTDIIPWNEADRPAEGGFPYETIAARFAELAPIVRDLCPGIRLHWPALSEEAGYASIGVWKDAAAQADALNGHWYRDANGIDALGNFFEAHFPGKEWFVTEYSSRGLNAPPPRLGVEQDAYEACRKAHLWPLCRGVIFFAWRWPGAEPGGQVEEIADDPETLAALHRAVMDFREAPAPQPDELAPIPEDWEARNANEAQKGHQYNWTPDRDDDGNDCISSSIAAALRLTYGADVPGVPAIEASYRRYHPDWNDTPNTMHLDWFWRALADIGVPVEALHQRGDIVDQIAATLARGEYPVIWAYLPAGDFTFHHAMVCVAYRDGRLRFWDQQVGIFRECSVAEFTTPGSPIASSGYAYRITYAPVAPVPEPLAPEVTMEPIEKSMMLHQYDHCREKTVAEWCDTLALGGIDCFRVKSHDGTDLMGRFYQHPLAPASLDEIARQYEAFGERGIIYFPWCVPIGRSVEAEASLAIEVARRCGNRIDVDLETGKGFWNVPAVGNARIVEYFQRIKDAGIDIILDTALFEGWVEALRLAELAPYVRRILSQSYDIGFSQQRGHTVDYRELFRHDVAEMRRTGIGEYGIILDARAGTGIATRAAYAQSLGCTEVSCWAADMATPDTYTGFLMVETDPFLDGPLEPAVDHWQEMNAAFHRGWEISQPGVTTLPDGTDISDEQVVLGEVSRIIGIVDRHRAALAGE